MRIAVTGATGLVGHPVARRLAACGHAVTTLGRTPLAGFDHRAWALGEGADLAGLDALFHAAFVHVPGRYRGGEGDDPEGFRRANLGGSRVLFDAARAAGVHVVFASTRAVYGAYPAGTTLTEDLAPRPDTLYGEVKLAAEAALAPGDVALRITGVYGPPVPGRGHKWADLFAAFRAGDEIAPRAGTEVHVADVADAVALAVGGAPSPLNVSDLTLDRRDLLAAYARHARLDRPLPERATGPVSTMATDRLRALGWTPRGPAGLDDALARIVAAEG